MIPDFLKGENRNVVDDLDVRFGEAVEQYNRHFPEDTLMTEPSVLSREEWINAIEKCIARDITIWELFGERYDSDALY